MVCVCFIGENKYGRVAERVGKDSIKEVDCCCLTLQPVTDGVVTYVLAHHRVGVEGKTLTVFACSPDGYLYEREAILQNLLHQKTECGQAPLHPPRPFPRWAHPLGTLLPLARQMHASSRSTSGRWSGSRRRPRRSKPRFTAAKWRCVRLQDRSLPCITLSPFAPLSPLFRPSFAP
jgi:hypothetical protein